MPPKKGATLLSPTTKTARSSIDLQNLPPKNPARPNDGQKLPSTTQPDLNGSTLLLIHRLIASGVFNLDSKIEEHKKIYESLKDAYLNHVKLLHKIPLDKTALRFNIQKFRQALNKIPVNKQNFSRFIGDVLADRGNQDAFTIFTLAHLAKNDAPFEILFSNHDANFFRAQNVKDFSLHNESGCFGSAARLSKLIQEGIIDEHEIHEIVERDIKPRVKLISYELRDDGGIDIFTHALVDLRCIQWAAEHYKVDYKDDTREALCKTIDFINAKFTEELRTGKAVSEYAEQLRESDAKDKLHKFISNKYPLINFTWSRVTDLSDQATDNNLQKTKTSYNVRFIHGHNGKRSVMENGTPAQSYVNLDCGQIGHPEVSLTTGDHHEFLGNAQIPIASIEYTKIISEQPFKLELTCKHYSYLDLTESNIEIIGDKSDFLPNALSYCKITSDQFNQLHKAGYRDFSTITLSTAFTIKPDIDLNDTRLSTDILSKLILQGITDFSNTILHRVDFSTLSINQCKFDNTKLDAQSLNSLISRANKQEGKTTFDKLDISGADLTDFKLQNETENKVELTNANLKDCLINQEAFESLKRLGVTDFSGAILHEITLTDGDIKKLTLKDCQLYNINITPTQAAELFKNGITQKLKLKPADISTILSSNDLTDDTKKNLVAKLDLSGLSLGLSEINLLFKYDRRNFSGAATHADAVNQITEQIKNGEYNKDIFTHLTHAQPN